MKSMWCNVLVMAVVVAMSGACRKAPEEEERTCIRLTSPDDRSDDGTRIRFGNVEKKDDETLAKEKAAQEWNRNLVLRNSSYKLEDYMKEYENK